MANFGQATFTGSIVLIHCGEKMSCCERDQARKKVDGYNADINDPTQSPGRDGSATPLEISPGSKGLASTKCTAQADAWRDFRARMEAAKTPKERQKVARDSAMADCVGDQIAAQWEKGKRSSRDLGVQMDHTIEVKWGGPAAPEGLVALGSRVNNFFGSISKRTGDDMRDAGQTSIAEVHFICDPPCSPPAAGSENNNYSTGPGNPPPQGPTGPTRTYLQD